MVYVVKLLAFRSVADELCSLRPQILHEQLLGILDTCLKLFQLRVLVMLYCVRTAEPTSNDPIVLFHYGALSILLVVLLESYRY